MNLINLLIVLTLFVSLPAAALDSPSIYPNLRDSLNTELQFNVAKSLNRLGLADAINRKQLSVVLVDITEIEQPKVASFNGDRMIYAASLPKIAILLGAFVQIERGKLSLDSKTRRTLTAMIRVSSNKAASQMLRLVGPRRLANILQSPQYRLYDPEINGGLWCGKEYNQGRLWRKDPLYNLSHAATAFQAARFYYLLETDRLVSPSLSRIMKEMLSKPGLSHKFVRGLNDQLGTKIYRKSGSWKHWHADSALVEHGRYKYIIAALAEHPEGNEWLTQLIAPLHALIVPHRLAIAMPE